MSDTVTPHRALGTPAPRREGHAKVTGAAHYAAEHTPPRCAYAWPVGATVARGRVLSVDDSAARLLPGVLAVLTPFDAPRLDTAADPDVPVLSNAAADPTLHVLQDTRVPHRGWPVALAVAETPEAAREAAEALHIQYAAEPFDVTLTPGHSDARIPRTANGGHPGERTRGAPEDAFAAAPVRVDTAYRTPPQHNHPMEPHAAVAAWHGDLLTVHDSSQGATVVATTLATLFALPEKNVTVHAEHVGGGFGGKGTPRPHTVLAAMAARHTGRPVKLALARRDLPALTGHRSPVAHRVRLAAEPDGTLVSVLHEATAHTSRIKEFTEQAAVPARVMYGSPHARTTHRVVPLDVPSPSWMRAPGETPGMYALESAMDELAEALDMDPVELRLRNDTAHEPDSGRPFSSRRLADCLREGAARFGWAGPRARQRGPVRTGTGVAAATYPVLVQPAKATARALPDGRYRVAVDATDIGTGARTVLAQIAADALGAPLDAVDTEIGSSALPPAPVAGGSSGTASWGWAVHEACTALADRLHGRQGPLPPGGVEAAADTTDTADRPSPYARHAFGAHFAEVAVDTSTGEVRVRRLLGVFAAGHILNPRTARSQFIGGMTMGLGMALTEGSTMEPAFGDFTENDLASYHVPTHADVTGIEAHWLDEDDPELNPMGSKGIGEIGIVGTAAAVGNAVHDATGSRYRELPLTPDRVLAGLT
ncbi:xanthine dehydrogenase family protein molybdopterin-binding subunit [Streptomyces sp. NPDC050560]|uniref:xanthine dehydrogenase family protein molybdopterin-binding subunit n=1 Tax=Streptomyces sp. NPDC050560 TaxID=3365630 RepID=UPI0037BA7752